MRKGRDTILCTLHCLNDISGVGGDGIETICFDHGLCYSFHVLSLQW